MGNSFSESLQRSRRKSGIGKHGRLGNIQIVMLHDRLANTSHMSAEFVFRYGPKSMGGLILPILVLLHV